MRLIAAAVATLAAVAAGSAGAAPSAVTLKFSAQLRLHGSFDWLTSDGWIATARPDVDNGNCRFIPVWNARTRKTITQRGCTNSGDVISDLAVAGTRIAWERFAYAGHVREQGELVLATIGQKPRVISDSFDEGGDGTWFGGLAGGGDTLAFTVHTDVFDDNNNTILSDVPYRVASSATAAGTTACPAAPDSIRSEPAPAHLCVPLAGSDSYEDVMSVDAGRVLAAEPGDTTGLFSADGTLHDLPIAIDTDKGEYAVLTGTTIVVLRAKRLEIRDAGTGALERALLVGGHGLSAGGGYAGFVTNGKITLVRLSDGREFHVRATGERRALSVALEPTGLFELYVGAGPATFRQRIGFVPSARLRAALR